MENVLHWTLDGDLFGDIESEGNAPQVSNLRRHTKGVDCNDITSAGEMPTTTV